MFMQFAQLGTSFFRLCRLTNSVNLSDVSLRPPRGSMWFEVISLRR
ncbi:unnamed protein product [Ixodes pacificus]